MSYNGTVTCSHCYRQGHNKSGCPDLKKAFEVYKQKVAKYKKDNPDCPDCEITNTLVKQISSTGFLLKGSGWYVTDFKESKKDPEKKDGDKLKNNNSKPENKKKSTNNKNEK